MNATSNTTTAAAAASILSNATEQGDYDYEVPLPSFKGGPYFAEIYLPKVAGAISILCSLVLITEILKDAKVSRNTNRQHQRGGRQTTTTAAASLRGRGSRGVGGPSAIAKLLFSVSVGDVFFSL